MAKRAQLKFLPVANASDGPDDVSAIGVEQGGESQREPDGPIGGIAGSTDAGTIDPVAVTQKRDGKRRSGRKKGSKWTEAQWAAFRARSGSDKGAAEKEDVAVEAEIEPADPPANIVEFVQASLYGIHRMMGPPEMHLSEQESGALAKAICNVAKYYMQIKASNKLTAWGALVMTAYMIYAPHVSALNARKAAEKAKPKPGPVVSPQGDTLAVAA